MTESFDKAKIYPGWYVAIACFFVTMGMGETMWSFGVFFKPLQTEFGWTRTLVSSGYTVFLIAYSLAAIASGRLSDRYGPRIILLVSGVLCGLGICFCSRIQTVNEFRFFLMIAGLGAGSTWTVPIATVQKWFRGRPQAGLALAIVAAGVGFGALVFAPLINYLILNHGWRSSFLVVGILYLVIIVSAAPLVRKSPVGIARSQGDSVPMVETGPEMSTAQALTHASFLILTFAGCVTTFTFQVLSVHLVPFVTDVGITPTIAAASVGLMGAVSTAGRLMAGPLSDVIGWKKTLVISLCGLTAMGVWLLLVRAEWMLYFFAVVFGLFWGFRTTSMVGAMGSFFGVRSLGELIGINGAVGNISGAFVPYIAGYVFDTLGSYRTVFASLTVLTLLASLLIMVMRKPAVQPSEPQVAERIELGA
jgi:MFS family permease